MAVELFTRRIAASEAPSIVAPSTPVLVPGRPEDIAALEKATSKYPLWRTHLSGPARSRQEEKWYRTLVGVVADGVGKHPQVLHCEIKYHAGKILSVIPSPIFGLALELKSSRQMDDDEFHAYVQHATDIIFSRYLPGVRRKDVFTRVHEMCGLRPPD